MKLKPMAKMPKEIKYLLIFVLSYLFIRMIESTFVPYIPGFITGEFSYFIKWFPILIPIFYGLYKVPSKEELKQK